MSATPPQYQQQPTSFELTHELSTISVVVRIAGTSYLVPSASVEMNAHGATGSATVTLPLKNQVDFTQKFAAGNLHSSIVPVQVYIGITQGAQPMQSQDVSISGKTMIFSGQADVYSIVYHNDSVTFRCRSLAAALVDNRITTIASNMTTTAFVATVALQYGLNPVIYVPSTFVTSTMADVYRHAISVGIQNLRIWDILVECAQLDDVDLWDDGSTLYYAAPGLVPRKTIDVKYGRDIEELTIEHAIYGSQKIRVEVRTGDKKTRVSTITRVETNDDGGVTVSNSSKVVTSTPAFGSSTTQTQSISSTGSITNTTTTSSEGIKNTSAGGAAPTANGPLIYKYYKPKMTQDQANKFAHAMWRKISMQLYSATIRIPMKRAQFADINIASLIRLHGLPTLKANDTYWPRRISWFLDIDSAPYIEIEAVNTVLPSGEV